MSAEGGGAEKGSAESVDEKPTIKKPLKAIANNMPKIDVAKAVVEYDYTPNWPQLLALAVLKDKNKKKKKNADPRKVSLLALISGLLIIKVLAESLLSGSEESQ